MHISIQATQNLHQNIITEECVWKTVCTATEHGANTLNNALYQGHIWTVVAS